MIYLASPYNHASAEVRQARYEANVRALAALLHDGEAAFSPIVHHHPVAVLRDLGRGWDFWRDVDIQFLKRCDKLFVLTLDGWKESVGVKAEIEVAQALRMGIHYMEPV